MGEPRKRKGPRLTKDLNHRAGNVEREGGSCTSNVPSAWPWVTTGMGGLVLAPTPLTPSCTHKCLMASAPLSFLQCKTRWRPKEAVGESPCSKSPAVLSLNVQGPFARNPGKGAIYFHVRWGRWERLKVLGSSLCVCRAWCGGEWGIWAAVDRRGAVGTQGP